MFRKMDLLSHVFLLSEISESESMTVFINVFFSIYLNALLIVDTSAVKMLLGVFVISNVSVV